MTEADALRSLPNCVHLELVTF